MAQGGHEVIEVDENTARSIEETKMKRGNEKKKTTEEESAATAEEDVSSEDVILVEEVVRIDDVIVVEDDSDDEEKQDDVVSSKDGYKSNETIEISDSDADDEDNEESDEVKIKRLRQNKLEFIEVDSTPVKKRVKIPAENPLAFNIDGLGVRKVTKPAPASISNSSGDSKSNYSNSCNKTQPTLVITDNNSIGNSASSHNCVSILPMTLRAPTLASPSPSTSQANIAVLPTLTDDMLVLEAPSLIVPHLYEQPPVNNFKTFLNDVKDQILKQTGEQQKKENGQKKGGDDDDAMKTDDVKDDGNKVDLKNFDFDPLGGPNKPNTYFESPLGKFFIDVGFKQAEEYVQSDLLSKQKRKLNRTEPNSNMQKTIQSLLKNLEYSKKKNGHFKGPLKKCEYCNFKTESLVVMANHLETPHIKNKMYECNFCPYKVLSPYDILSHMEAKHGIKGRLEKAPALHPCPICPYETKKKSNVTRHLVSCEPKFKPKKNLEPTADWEPPAKIVLNTDQQRPTHHG